MWKEELENLREIVNAKGLSANQGLINNLKFNKGFQSIKVYLDQVLWHKIHRSR